MAIDDKLLQRIRRHIDSWPRDDKLRDVVLVGERPARVHEHMLCLLDAGEIVGRAIRVRAVRGVLVTRLTPEGMTAMLDAAAAETEATRSVAAKAKLAAAFVGKKIGEVSWKTASAVVLAAVTAWVGFD